MKYRFARCAIALVLSFTLALAVFAPVVVSASTVVYSLQDDAHIQGLDVGTEGAEAILDDTPYLTNAGGPTFTIVENPLGGNAIRISDRTANWNALDVQREPLGLSAGGTYTMRVSGSFADPGEGLMIQITGAESPWGWIHREPAAADGSFEIEATFTADELDEAGADVRIRVNTPDDFLTDYTIYEIVITAAAAAPAEPDPIAENGDDAPPPQEPAEPAQASVLRMVIGETSYTLNGYLHEMEAAPFIDGVRTMVPVRLVAEAMGAVVGFIDETRTVTITLDGVPLLLPVDVPLYEADGSYMGTPVIVHPRTLVPVRFVAENLGATVRWDGDARAVYIYFDGEPAVTPPPLPPEPPAEVPPPPPAGDATGDGIFVQMTAEGDSVSGAIIFIGEGTDVWPFAAGPEEGARAFTPEPGVTYRLSFNVTSTGIGGWRVRWVHGTNLFGEYTAGDGEIVNAYEVETDVIATVIPAHFNIGVESGETYTLVVDITLDGAEEYDGLIGNIVLVGTGGGHGFTVNWVRAERLTGGPGSASAEVLAYWR